MNFEELKRRKKELNLTTNQLAMMIEMPYGTVSKAFTGETKNPSYLLMEKIDEALGRLEFEARVAAYLEAMEKYLDDHTDEDFDQDKFEKSYREKNQLSDKPIPFALPGGNSTEGNLALNRIPYITVPEYLQMDTESNIELLDGRLIFSQAPDYKHQMIVEAMGDVIKKYIADNDGGCKVHTAGINVRLDEDDNSMLIPDLVVICGDHQICEYGILGVPDFIVEVTSPSTRRMDYRDKLYKYMKSGVREYWVVDLQKRIVATYINDMPLITGVYRLSDEIPVSIYGGKLKISIASLYSI